ncbi:MAG: alkaline phosphatase [Planctomycetota bacterium]|nr:MAG: alkaline phosphatase [Planctomycetota bacterium]
MKKRRKSLTIENLVIVFLIVLGSISLSQGVSSYRNGEEGVNYISGYQASPGIKSYPLLRTKKVKNVILCIGDGMGLGQVVLARMKAAGLYGKLYMERMPVTGIVRTHSADSLVTDSAAAGTALAAGVKTMNGMLSMGPDGKKYQTVLELAKKKGMRTGLVATSSITHATPAAFGSHVKSRGMQDKIAEHLLANKINVLLGGGRGYFLPKSNTDSARTDERNLISEAETAGYSYIQTAEELRSAQGPYLLGLFQVGPLVTESPEPTLGELMKKAIEVLNDRKRGLFGKSKGFFLMVEGSQIDWACHDNNADNTVKELLCFDEAIECALEFALRDKHTLVVVVADHETGGLTVKGGNLECSELDIDWATTGHTGLPVPIYAFGPRADIFSGVYDNTEVAKKLAQLLGTKRFPRTIK